MRRVRGIIIGIAVMGGLLLAQPGSSAAGFSWKEAPVVPSLGKTDQSILRARVEAGREGDLRPGVFAKVGDSNTEFSPELYGLGCRKPVALPPRLRETLSRYRKVRLANPRAIADCAPGNSFSRRSSAAQAGVFSTWATMMIGDLPEVGYLKPPPGCPADSTPLTCEVETIRPRYAAVMLGTNDIGMDLYFGIKPGSQIRKRLGQVVRKLLSRGVVPVLSTIPPVVTEDPSNQAAYDLGIARTNAGIWKLSRAWHLPMVNLWRSLTAPGVVSNGLSSDGLHLSVFGAAGEPVSVDPRPGTLADSVDFSSGALAFGANRRNLIWLKTLARLDRYTG